MTKSYTLPQAGASSSVTTNALTQSTHPNTVYSKDREPYYSQEVPNSIPLSQAIIHFSTSTKFKN